MTTTTQAAIRLAILDSDSGFLQVLTKRLGAAGWQHRVLASPVPLDTLVAMRLNAVVIDLAVLGPQAWNYLEKLCERLPQLGVIVCTGQSSVAQRVRGLRMGADDWVTKPCHPEELIARVEAVVRRRKRAEARPVAAPVAVGEIEIRADQFQACGPRTAGSITTAFRRMATSASSGTGEASTRCCQPAAPRRLVRTCRKPLSESRIARRTAACVVVVIWAPA